MQMIITMESGRQYKFPLGDRESIDDDFFKQIRDMLSESYFIKVSSEHNMETIVNTSTIESVVFK
jgi:hypothetical protein